MIMKIYHTHIDFYLYSKNELLFYIAHTMHLIAGYSLFIATRKYQYMGFICMRISKRILILEHAESRTLFVDGKSLVYIIDHSLIYIRSKLLRNVIISLTYCGKSKSDTFVMLNKGTEYVSIDNCSVYIATWYSLERSLMTMDNMFTHNKKHGLNAFDMGRYYYFPSSIYITDFTYYNRWSIYLEPLHIYFMQN